MASSSTSLDSTPASTYSQSCNYDVFLSFRGEDTRKTFVDHLYSTLVSRMISTYKDDETLLRGESISPSLFNAIEGSRIALIIFSESYADSSWCLEELTHIMKCKAERNLTVMPIFHGVTPSEVRKQEGAFGEGFAKQEAGNIDKVDAWRKALVAACEIAGWETKNIANGHESRGIKEIVGGILKKLFSFTSDVDEELVGIRARVQELEPQLKIGSDGVRMVGIWGCGGSGKTTLANSLCKEISHCFQGHCIVDNIREESRKHGLKKLQEKIISGLLKTKVELESVEEGKVIIKSRLSHSNVLILLDDVDDIEQLEALAGSHNWFGSGSRIIITTRDEHLLITHNVDKVCPVRLLSHEEATQLFNKRAYNEKKPVKDYNTLSSSVVSYADGLPLALKVLGSFLCAKDEEEWRSTLSRLKDIPKNEILQKLRISYDGLETVDKELFLDITCFLRGESIRNAVEILEACGYHPHIGLKVLREKALITIVDEKLEMHDLIQGMGHHIVREEHPNNPEKHSRVWKHEDINSMCFGDATMENDKIEGIQYFYPAHGQSSLFYKSISNLKKLRFLRVILNNDGNGNAKGPSFLSNELRYMDWQHYPINSFPQSFQPVKLVTLKLSHSLQKKLWKEDKRLPHLKVLQLEYMANLLRTPNFSGLPCLQKFKLRCCEKLTGIHESLGTHTSLEYISIVDCRKLRKFPTIVHMGKLKTLKIKSCHESLEFPEIKSNVKNLVKLYLSDMGIDDLLSSIGERCANVVLLNLVDCYFSNSRTANFDGLKHLEEFKLSIKMRPHSCISLLVNNVVCRKDPYKSPCFIRFFFQQMTCNLQKLDLSGCDLKDGDIPPDIGELSNLQELNLSHNDFTKLDFSLSQLTRLKLLDVSCCAWLVELCELPTDLTVLKANECPSLTTIEDFYTNCKWLSHVSLLKGTIMNDANKLLQFMLEGNAIENHCMLLLLDGSEIGKEFTPHLLRGSRCRLKLPQNWCHDFCGFLVCAVVTGSHVYINLTMEQMMTNEGMDFEEDVVWEQSDNHYESTLVWYVPFASLRHTAWWDEIHEGVLFSIHFPDVADTTYRGFGVRPVMRKSGTTRASSQEDNEFSQYTPKFNIVNDSRDALQFFFNCM